MSMSGCSTGDVLLTGVRPYGEGDAVQVGDGFGEDLRDLVPVQPGGFQRVLVKVEIGPVE